jgi:hypothetical protein
MPPVGFEPRISTGEWPPDMFFGKIFALKIKDSKHQPYMALHTLHTRYVINFKMPNYQKQEAQHAGQCTVLTFL